MSRFTRGFITGAIIGGVYTLLNAKQTGKETREAIKSYIHQAQNDVQEVQAKSDNLRTALGYLTKEALPLAQQVTTELQVKLKGFQAEVQPRLRRINEKLNDLSANMKE